MKSYLLTIFNGFISLIKGFRITLKYLFTHAVTVRYPEQKLVLPDRFRGVLSYDKSICTGCGLCARICPSQCITLQTRKDEITGKRFVESYEVFNGRCNFCGLCVEICPLKIKAIKHTKNYEIVFYNREEMTTKW
ncbi:MAG: NADH-quinone oxidoreductase subunit I [Elusimicrobia bacterium]|nr:NADH-quinone oxidoreductase subunit I [Elusimicrobiota bacterium]